MSDAQLAELVAVALAIALNAYVLLGGADFGGGVWDLFATGPRRAAQRELVADAIGPIWEANHVWLILAVVLLFTCFPPAFARLGIVLHIPFTLMLLGIVMRGSAFAFRSYGAPEDRPRWGRIFAIASLITPFVIGICVGTIAAGRVVHDPVAGFVDGYVRPWLTPFALSVGLLTLALFAFLAAVYLTCETAHAELREDFRVRALGSAVAVGAAAWLAFALAPANAPLVWHGLARSGPGLALQLAIAATALFALWALWRRHYRLARAAAVLQVTLVFWGWVMSQFPYVIPPDLTLTDAAAPRITLELVLIALALGALVLIPSLVYLLRVFKGRVSS